MHPIMPSLSNVLFPVKKKVVEFRKPRGYKNVSCTEMVKNIKKNNYYCVIS